MATNPPVDKQLWVEKIRETLEEELEEDTKTSVSVFCVPKTLLACKPEAYTPQLFALGPYHHWQPHLYEMERYKLATTKRMHRQLRHIKLPQLVQEFENHEHEIRSHYHRYLDFSGETLAWLMTIDASFLLEFLRNYSDDDQKTYRKVPSMSHMVDSARIKLAYNSIVKDVVMLENQIPLFLVRKIMHFQCSSTEEADAELSKMLMAFVREISPFKVLEKFTCIDVTRHAHLLGLLYFMIVPKTKEVDEPPDDIVAIHVDDDEPEKIGNPGYVWQLFGSVWSTFSGTKGVALEFVKKVLNGKPIKFLVKVPWRIISNLPVISVFKGPIESMLCFKGGEKDKDEDSSSSNGNKPPLVEEIMIPSVTELTRAGVKFCPTTGDLNTIQFDTKTATFFLPKVSLDCNTEILMRNLVAYEASVESGPMVFTRYTELINGIIDTEEDVKLLRQSGIILNRLKSDGEVADLWNEMRKSVRLSKVAAIDKLLADVNKYYNSRWSVKTKWFMKTYVLGSWQLLTFLAAILLLLLTCMEAFCSVYECGARWSSISNADET